MRLIRGCVSTAVLPKIADKGLLPEPTSSPDQNLSDLAVRAATSYRTKRTSVTIFALESSYGQELSDKLARDCRALMMSAFYKALFETRISADRNAVAEFETTDGGYRLSTSVGGVVTGRGADLIIVDDPMKADDALSDARRQSVNAWYDNTLRSRLNRQDEGAIIVVMQRLHADDLVAHLQETEHWDLVLLPLIAEREELYALATPYGRRRIHRRADEVLHPALLSASAVEGLRRSMTEYNFAAQYQQDPQPPSGLIVRREWLRFYKPNESAKNFEQIVQSWDTANKATELSDYSVCTTWGFDGKRLYLLNVFRRKMEFPELKRTVRELAGLWKATVVLIEDKSSGGVALKNPTEKIYPPYRRARSWYRPGGPRLAQLK